MAWKCVSSRIEAVVSIAKTSKSIQPCDQNINIKCHELMRELREDFCQEQQVDTTKVNFNIVCAVYTWENLEKLSVTSSFHTTGIYPFQRNIAERFREDEESKNERVSAERRRLNNVEVAFQLPFVRKRQSNSHTMIRVADALKRQKYPSETLKELSDMLLQVDTVATFVIATMPLLGSCS